MGSMLIVAIVCLLSACGEKASTSSAKKNDTGTQQGLKIAYVEVDSIMTQYKFATEYSAILKKKMQTIQATMQSKGISLQKEAAEFQNKMQAHQLTQEQATAMQNSLQKKQMQLQNLQESLTSQYQKSQDKYNKALHDSIQSFLKGYNKELGYDYILSKSGDNILYAGSKMDITVDVIKGLNKRYEESKK